MTGRITPEEKKRVEKSRVHTGKSAPAGKMGYDSANGVWVFIPDPPEPPPVRVVHVSFRNDVVIASSVGVCMFCSRPDATMRFRNDDSVRICTRCVE